MTEEMDDALGNACHHHHHGGCREWGGLESDGELQLVGITS